MKKESKKFKVKSRDKQSKTTGVRHSDDDVKKAVVDRIFKIEQLNNIPERYVANHSNCSRSSIGRMCKCKFDGQSPIPDWTTIHNYSACIIGKSEFIPGFPEVLCHVLNLIVDDSADIGSPDNHWGYGINLSQSKEEEFLIHYSS